MRDPIHQTVTGVAFRCIFIWCTVACTVDGLAADEIVGTAPLRIGDALERVEQPLQASVLLDDPAHIERFLDQLEGQPPDWVMVYGHGHHDPGHDERLFNLNRERDTRREGHPGLQTRLTFLWPGELSGVDAETGGFRVAIGPKFLPTRWGVVRFKPEDLPGNLITTASPTAAAAIRERLQRGERVEVVVAMTGRLIPEESIVYDFSHDQEGLGLIMPVVRIETLQYYLKPLQ